MRDDEYRRFRECLDTVQIIEKPVRKGLGEDSFYCSESRHSAIVSVFDGCGGLGARKYASFQDHTGAYIASRAVCGAVHDWYCDYSEICNWRNAQQIAMSLDDYIHRVYEICESYATQRRKIMGSMVRSFPTTIALIHAVMNDGILLNILWAGDSRVYLLDENGLFQLTIDDTDVADAFENLTNDGVMNNVLSSDGKYRINTKTIRLKKPGLIFAATDGCFGYFLTPMEFEYCILKALVESENPDIFRRSLRKTLESYAGDDFTFGLMSFYYGSYANTRKHLADRLNYMRDQYINPLVRNGTDEIRQQLWLNYKKDYERYLNQGEVWVK